MTTTQIFEQQVEQAIRREQMIPDGAPVLTALSGGADSVALLLVLCALQKTHGWRMEALHVEHGIRGRDSLEDAAFCETLCRERGVPLTVVHEDVPGLARRDGIGLEEAGRRVRYARLRERAQAMDPEGHTRIALAHHAQDSAETMLFHLARGTGVDGLCGIAPVREEIVRPLICCTREQITAYLGEQGQPWRTDATNADSSYARNRLRMEAIPAMTAVNAQAVEHMSDTAAQMTQLRAWLQRTAQGLLLRYASGQHRLSHELLSEDPVPAKEALRLWLSAECGVPSVERVHVDAAHTLLRRGRGHLSLPGGGRVQADQYGLQFLSLGENGSECRPITNTAASPGRIDVPPSFQRDHPLQFTFGGWRFSFLLRDAFPGEELQWSRKDARLRDASPGEEAQWSKKDAPWQEEQSEELPEARPDDPSARPNCYTKCFDYDKIGHISIRTRQAGDSLIIGGGHHKSLRRWFVDAHVPGELRGRIPLLCDGSEVLWIVGGRMGDRCKLTADTRNVLEICAVFEDTPL